MMLNHVQFIRRTQAPGTLWAVEPTARVWTHIPSWSSKRTPSSGRVSSRTTSHICSTSVTEAEESTGHSAERTSGLLTFKCSSKDKEFSDGVNGSHFYLSVPLQFSSLLPWSLTGLWGMASQCFPAAMRNTSKSGETPHGTVPNASQLYIVLVLTSALWPLPPTGNPMGSVPSMAPNVYRGMQWKVINGIEGCKQTDIILGNLGLYHSYVLCDIW